MTSADHTRIKELFVAACGQPESERRKFLASACGSDDNLRLEVEELLSYHEPEPPRRIGPYRLVRHLGEGGMGEVWEAEQEEPVRRNVALKVIRAGMDSRQVVARFESERQALALMDHAHVAHVFDAGTTEDGRPYFVMELLDGVPITTYCDRHGLTTLERVELLIAVCEGVHHAHQKGIIHRDIKPSNVLVQTVDGRAVPKVIDFGVAKATHWTGPGRPAATTHGMLLGTPGYMSPEQAATAGVDVDTRADVYSLGVLLYRVLVGVGPLGSPNPRDQSLEETLRRIREEEATRPSTRIGTLGDATADVADRRGTSSPALRRQIKGDLDWITMKALDKDRERRYPSAAELAADLGRHLRHEPVLASPPTLPYRARKLFLRHRTSMIAASIAALALAAGTAGVVTSTVRAQREAETARRVAELLLGTFAELNPNARGGRVASAEEILDDAMVEIEAELGRRPIVQARLFASMGQAYLALGRFPRAMNAMESAVTLRREHLGVDETDTQSAVNELVEVLFQWGDFTRAEQLLGEARNAQLGAESPDPATVGWTLLNLGILRMRQGDLDDAKRLMNEALAVSLAALGPLHFDMARNHFWLGAVEWLRTDFEASWSHTWASLAAIDATIGTEHPYAGWPLFQLGLLHTTAGRPDSASIYYRRAIDLEERTLGVEHPNLAYPLQALGGLLAAQGDPLEGLPLLERALSINQRAFGADHPALTQILNELGVAQREMGDLEEARETHRRALSILEDSGWTRESALTLEFLATVEERAGNPEEARDLRSRVDSVAGG